MRCQSPHQLFIGSILKILSIKIIKKKKIITCKKRERQKSLFCGANKMTKGKESKTKKTNQKYFPVT